MKDEELVKKVKNGDIDAFEQIIALYESKVFSLIYHMIKNENEIEDLAQEVFIRVYTNIKKFNGNSSLYTWIYKITTNLCIDYIKRKKEVIYLDEKLKLEDNEVEMQIPSDEKRQDELYEDKELKEKLEKCIDKLPEKQKAIIILRDIKGFSYEEIAYITGIKLGTVKSQINRARQKLKNMLERDGTFIEYIESK